jgi:hypothetical protein
LAYCRGGGVLLSGIALRAGDEVRFESEADVRSGGGRGAEILVFDPPWPMAAPARR